jgi:site-specific recombinase XerD
MWREHWEETAKMRLERFDLEHAIELYLTACRGESKQPNTVVVYQETLEMFLGVAREVRFAGDVRSITTEHIYKWPGWVKDRGVTDQTLHRRHCEAKFVFVWLQRIGVIAANPFDPIKSVQIPQKVVDAIKLEHIRKLLNA